MNMFIEDIFCWSRCVPPQGVRDSKPTTAELEPQGTSVWIHVVNAAGETRAVYYDTTTKYSRRSPGACFEIHNEILLKYIMLQRTYFHIFEVKNDQKCPNKMIVCSGGRF